MIFTFPPRTKNLGPELIAYLLRTDADQATRMLDGEFPPTKEQSSVLQMCEAILASIAKSRQHNVDLEYHDITVLTSHLSASGRSIFSEMRLPHSDNDELPSDAAERALSKLCAECFPFALLPNCSVDHFSNPIDFPSFYRTRILEDFIDGVCNDPSLRKLFPSTASHFSQSHFIYTSFGRGLSFDLCSLHENIIRAAVALMHMYGKNNVNDLQLHAIEMLRALRRLAEGEDIQLPVVETYDLMGLPMGTEISVGNGILKAIPDHFLKSIPRGARPSQDGSMHTIGCMLIQNATFSIFLAPPDFNYELVNGWPLEMTKLREHDFDVVSLATGLALDETKATAARARATITIDPLNGIGQIWSNSTRSLGTPHLATDAECQRIKELWRLLEQYDTKPIQTAAKRFIGASINRNDVEDSLIDAVVGLESLFGARTEIAFHVASGVSRLLGKDLETREEIFKATKKIYDARSKIVHGNPNVVERIDVPAERERALSFLKKCLTTLIEHRQNLLNLNSETRVRTLILGE